MFFVSHDPTVSVFGRNQIKTGCKLAVRVTHLMSLAGHELKQFVAELGDTVHLVKLYRVQNLD